MCVYKRYRRGVRDSRSQCVIVSFPVSLRIRTTILLCCTFTPAACFLLETPSIHHSFNSRCWNIFLKCKSYLEGRNTLNHSFRFQLFSEFISSSWLVFESLKKPTQGAELNDFCCCCCCLGGLESARQEAVSWGSMTVANSIHWVWTPCQALYCGR